MFGRKKKKQRYEIKIMYHEDIREEIYFTFGEFTEKDAKEVLEKLNEARKKKDFLVTDKVIIDTLGMFSAAVRKIW